MQRTLCAALLLTTALWGQEVFVPGQPPQARTQQRAQVVPNSYIVTFTPGTSRNDRANAAFFAGAAVRFVYDNIPSIAITVPNDAALTGLRNNPAVTNIAPVHVVTTQAKPTGGGGGGKGGGGNGGGTGGGSCCSPPGTLDTRQLISFEVQRVGVPTANSDGTGIGVAVIDSGIDFNHPDLAPSGTSFSTFNNGSCQDDGGHGTHVSGMIAALNNSIAIEGVAPAATLYCVKVLDGTLSGDDATVIAGLDWVVSNHAVVSPKIRVVNMSLGRPLDTGETLATAPMHSEIQLLYNAGVVVVAAAGNDPTLDVSEMIPAGFSEVLSVASTTAAEGVKACTGLFVDLPDVLADTASGFTTDGQSITVSAPGEQHTDVVNLSGVGCVGLEYGTLSTTMGTQGASRKIPTQVGIQEARGTSFAAPLVSGIVARVLQMGLAPLDSGSTTTETARTWIKANANRVGTAPLDNPWAGIVYDYTFDGIREGIAQAPH